MTIQKSECQMGELLVFMSICAAVLVCGAFPLRAEATTYELGGSIAGDFNAGADPLVKLKFSDGSEQTIKGGSGLTLSADAGAIFFDHQQHQLETMITLGMKFSSMKPASNADLTFIRVPIELLAFYRNEQHFFRVGAGTAFHLVNSLHGSGAASNFDTTFDSAIGGVFQADFIWKEFALGMRYTVMRYSANNIDESVAANSIGINLNYMYQWGSKN